jgi:hypothetical protein
MRKTRNALLGILTMMSGAILAVPTDAAERIPGGYVYKAGPERLFSYPYGGTHLRVDYAKRRFGAIHTSAPTTVVTMPPGTTTTTALPTIGMRRLQQQFFTLGPPDWLKMKNADAPAVKREAEEDWTR